MCFCARSRNPFVGRTGAIEPKKPIDVPPPEADEPDPWSGRTTEAKLVASPATSEDDDRPTLTVITGMHAGMVIELDNTDVYVGRTPESKIFARDDGVSRSHARFSRGMDGSTYVEDLESRNGTFLNGVKIARERLTSGDKIQFGPNLVVRFALVGKTEEALAKQLYEASTRDPLTRAFNRRYFIERLASEVAYSLRHNTPLGLIIFDLDYFKRVNDTHGHPAGDAVLRAVSALAQKTLRAEDVFARYGGEEFAVIVRGVPMDGLCRTAERLREGVESLEIKWKPVLKVTISVGVALLEEAGTRKTTDALIFLADERLYAAKANGRNCIVSTSEA